MVKSLEDFDFIGKHLKIGSRVFFKLNYFNGIVFILPHFPPLVNFAAVPAPDFFIPIEHITSNFFLILPDQSG